MAVLIVGIDQAFSAWQGSVYPPDAWQTDWPDHQIHLPYVVNATTVHSVAGFSPFFNACKRTTGPA